MYNLQKIDELYLPSHKYLEAADECYYFMDYTPPVKENKTPENSIIINFKKKMHRKGLGDWHYKTETIKWVSDLFVQNTTAIINPGAVIVPVPPSYIKGHKMYDDRLIQVAQNFSAARPDTEFRELISLNSEMNATHEEEKTTEELKSLLSVDEALCAKPAQQIVIIDDVLRFGAHFKAIKNILEPKFPDAQFIGLYIARRRV
jgi:hypothetical protein